MSGKSRFILAFETSSPEASLALFDASSGGVLAEEHFTTERSHHSKIFGPLSNLLDRCERNLCLIAVGTGPGSYSGVRVAIAAAQGISLALNCPLRGVSSLEAFPGENYLVAGDARRNSFFLAEVRAKRLAGQPQLLGADMLREKAHYWEGLVYTTDESVRRILEGRASMIYPQASEIARRSAGFDLSNSSEGSGSIEPHYLRPPYITEAKKKPVPGFI